MEILIGVLMIVAIVALGRLLASRSPESTNGPVSPGCSGSIRFNNAANSTEDLWIFDQATQISDDSSSSDTETGSQYSDNVEQDCSITDYSSGDCPCPDDSSGYDSGGCSAESGGFDNGGSN